MNKQRESDTYRFSSISGYRLNSQEIEENLVHGFPKPRKLPYLLVQFMKRWLVFILTLDQTYFDFGSNTIIVWSFISCHSTFGRRIRQSCARVYYMGKSLISTLVRYPICLNRAVIKERQKCLGC